MSTIEQALVALKKGNMIVVTDDENRENEGDLIMAAQFATPESINFITKYARGLICMPLSQTEAHRLELPQMIANNTDNHGTAFTISIDHEDTTTGISAYDRALTLQKAADPDVRPEKFRRPGHIFPLTAREGGVIERNGHTEATVDLLRLAGLTQVGVCCEIMSDDGTMARFNELKRFSKDHGLVLITIKDLQEYISESSPAAVRRVTAKLPTRYGTFSIAGYENMRNGKEEVALYMGDIRGKEDVLVRVHSECMTGDVFGSEKCDCGAQLAYAMKKIAERGSGALIYLRQEGRSIGLINKLKAYKLQEEGLDTVEANLAIGMPEDARSYVAASDIIKDLGIESVELMTNNPDKINKLEKQGIKISKRVPIEPEHSHKADEYLKTKAEKMGHIFTEVK